MLWKIRRVLEDSAREYHLLVGDDASTDATTEVLAPYASVLPLSCSARPAERQGYAATAESLLRDALQLVRPAQARCRDSAAGRLRRRSVRPPEFLRRIDSGADVIVGEATLEGESDKWQARVRRWAPRLLGRNARVEGVRDVVSGYVAFRLIALRNAFRDRTTPWLTTEGWAANAELLSWAAAGARRVETVPVSARADRHTREHRHAPWQRARALWAARGQLTVPSVELRAAKGAPREKDAA